MVNAVPDGFNTVSTYLIVPNAKEALELYKKALGAEPGVLMEMPDGSTMHAEMRIGDSTVMLSDENPQWGAQAPQALGGTPVSLHLYVEDVDALFQQAVSAGFEVEFPPTDMFWGDRFGKLNDPYGHKWGIATHTKDMSPEEMMAGRDAWLASMGDQACE